MIETFVANQCTNDTCDAPELAVKQNENILLALVLGLLAAYVAYVNNEGEDLVYRIVRTVGAFFFPVVYFIYYIFRYILL